MNDKTPKTNAAPTAPPLHEVRVRAEHVKDKVEAAGNDLSTVNEVLKDELKGQSPTAEVAHALTKSEDVEVQVQECVVELEAVNEALATETDERAQLGRELRELTTALQTSKTQEKQTRLDAMHDPLTGLPNLTLFVDRLKQGLAQARRHGWRLAVVFLDIDRFKHINDTHGHDVGDGVLQLVAQRLKTGLRAGDTVCRRSGDEFLLLMLEVGSERDVLRLLTTLRASLAAPADVKGLNVAVDVSMGAAVFPEDGQEPRVLLERADVAMYAAKRRGELPMLFSAVPPAPPGPQPVKNG
ncbi:MAG: GGDEF domain-containing protein [Myxococcales bacterium]|nr:GGDEF domain-containing protein [Myxococcales bacterium]